LGSAFADDGDADVDVFVVVLAVVVAVVFDAFGRRKTPHPLMLDVGVVGGAAGVRLVDDMDDPPVDDDTTAANIVYYNVLNCTEQCYR
jgi:hypothetical protein